jgi:ubiquinone/menaquinone biosynthesis C-methylase UbiE
MDRSDNVPAELEGALEDIRSVNRFLGGSKALLDAVRPHLAAAGDGVSTILDVGTGGADLPLELVAAARHLGRRVRIVAVDRDPVTVAYARRRTEGVPEIDVVTGDARTLPYPAGAFDFVTASLFLHHFTHDDAVPLVAEFRRIARRAVVVNDLERHVLPWAFIALAARLTRRHPMFVHDAPLSVLRGFTEAELRRIATDAGARRATVQRVWPYRLLMTLPAEEGAS